MIFVKNYKRFFKNHKKKEEEEKKEKIVAERKYTNARTDADTGVNWAQPINELV
jgi:hypothetical protein